MFCFAADMDDLVINFRWIDFAIDDDDDFAYKYIVEVIDPEFGPLEVKIERYKSELLRIDFRGHRALHPGK